MNCIQMTWQRKLSTILETKLELVPGCLDNILFWELDRFIDDKEAYVAELAKRDNLVVLSLQQKYDPTTFVGDEALTLRQMLESKFSLDKEIKGRSACAGKVTGTVKVINKVSDFGLFEKGDILVSAMTRPEFLPVMEKAGAIITDEGGLTCHAAIVSRELNVPCIVGTEVATRILKSGDRVEVDAEKGIVRKL